MNDCCHQVRLIGQHEENENELIRDIPNDLKDVEKTIKSETLFMPVFKKRKRLSRSKLIEIKAELGGNQTQTSSKFKSKKPESIERWSSARYKLAEQSMWEVLKDKDATFSNPISRPALRMAARKRIGDTGLLDHLLKHIDGRVAPCGTERFRRWFNTKGIMEYWLESASLDKARQDAGVQDPYWIPPCTFKAGSPPTQNSDSSGELRLLQIEMAQMKKDMEELLNKNQERNEINMMEETHKELVKWKAMTEQRLTVISTSLESVQGMYGDLVNWKSKVEQQLEEITNKLTDLKASREGTTNPSLDRWEDLFESTNLEHIQGEVELLPWFESTELVNLQQEVAFLDPNSALPSQLLNDNMTNIKSDFLEMLPNKQEVDQTNVTPDSSVTVNSKSDLDHSVMLFQEMLTDLFKWKDKVEKQMAELSNFVYGMLATN